MPYKSGWKASATLITIAILAPCLLVLAGPPPCAQTMRPGRESHTVAHNTWTSGTAMPVAAQGAAAAVVGDQIYVVGGWDGSGPIADTQIYDPTARTWEAGPPLPVATQGAASAAVNNILYIIGGATSDGATNAVWAYDPSTKSWSAEADMPTARIDPGAAVVNNIIYVVGGVISRPGGYQRFTRVESYNPNSNKWRRRAQLLVGKSEPSVARIGSTIVAADGYTAHRDTGDNESYSPRTNSWTMLAADPNPRNEACSGSIGGRLFVAGGSHNGRLLDSAESFNLLQSKWARKVSMPQAVTGAGSAVYNGQLYCLGGGDLDIGRDVFDYVQIYQP